MKIMRLLSLVGYGNYVWTLSMDTEEKNRNILNIHDQSMGRTIYTNEEIWDSDLTKIIRILKKYEYSRLNLKEIINKLNKGCRHLNIVTL